MPYGPESHTGYATYSAVLRHVVVDREVLVQVSASTGVTTPPANLAELEAQNDALFESVLADIVALGSLVVVSATKSGGYTADVTL